jgi:hypothetical protein
MPKTFALLDDERFFVARLHRQREVRQDERHLVANVVVLRAANDRPLLRTVNDLADRSLSDPGTLSFVRICAMTIPSNSPATL